MTDKVQKIREEVARRLEDAKAGVRQNQNRVKFGIDNKQDLVIWQHLESMAVQLLSFIDSLQEEPVSEELEKVAELHTLDDSIKPWRNLTKEAFKAGAKWQEEKDNEEKVLIYKHGFDDCKEQFEKNRLAACDKQTEEETQIESDFIMGIIEKEHRQPTFDDAIKYGMRYKEQLLMANTADATIGLPYENKDGGYTHLIDVSRPLPVGDNKIAIIFKED